MANCLENLNAGNKMRIREILIENTKPTAGEYSTGVVRYIIEDVWSAAYPKARLYTGDSFGSNPVFASTKKQYVKDQEYYDGLADPKGHFYLQLSVGYDLPELVINVLDAHAGKFSGIVTKMFDEIYKRLESNFRDQPTRRTLTVQDDASGGAWQHIAQKLGANSDLHRSHMIQSKAVASDDNESLKEFVGPSDDDDGSEPTPPGDFPKFKKIITTELAKLGFKTKQLHPNLKGGFGCIRKRDENTLDAIMFVPITDDDVLVKQGSIEDGRPYFDSDFMYRVSATVDDAIYCLTRIEQDYDLL
jgi:hypothetical protein